MPVDDEVGVDQCDLRAAHSHSVVHPPNAPAPMTTTCGGGAYERSARHQEGCGGDLRIVLRDGTEIIRR